MPLKPYAAAGALVLTVPSTHGYLQQQQEAVLAYEQKRGDLVNTL